MSKWRKRYDTRHIVNRAIASRALFSEARGSIPHIAFQIEMTNGETVEFELEIAEAKKLIEQMVSAYNAVYPVLKTSRGGIGL